MKQLHLNGPLYAPAHADGADGGGGNAAFDHVAFQASLLGEVNKTLNGFAKTLKLDIGKLTAAPVVAAAVTDPNPDDATLASGVVKPSSDPAGDARFKALERQNKQLLEQFGIIQKQSEATNAAAETKERHSSIRDTLAGFQFGSDSQRDTAFRIFRDDIRRTADGSLVGGSDEAPLKEYIGEQMKNHSYLLAPKDVGGAGARGGKAQGGAKAVDLDSIKPGMSAADMAAVSAEISAAINGR